MFLSKQLNLFIAMAEEKSYKKAAERLYLTVPPVFKMLKEIEEWAECKLFENLNGRLLMTREGQELYNTLFPIYRELHNVKVKKTYKTYKTKVISLTSNSPDSDIVTDLSLHLLKDNITFVNIKNEKERLLGSDIHVSTTKKKHDDNITEFTLEESMRIWFSNNKNINLSNVFLAQDHRFYGSTFYHSILNNLQEIGYKENGIIIDNIKVRKDMVSRGIAASIDSCSWGKDIKNIFSSEMAVKKKTFIYVRNNILEDVIISLNSFVLS
ncbi:helix-turn-helix domain-containing protein, partial [Yersinia ruckeri]